MDVGNLIVDVGMHIGLDTAFYLEKGFDVLAIEANPLLVDEASQRFSRAIEEGRLRIVNVAIADHEGHVDLHVSEESGWSSTSRARAGAALGKVTRPVRVRAATLDAVLASSASPYFIKIDIEGADQVAVRAISRLPRLPKYISFEADLSASDEVLDSLELLEGLGFSRFKIINQAANFRLRAPYPPLEGRFVDARFSGESSGLFGEETPGEWLALNEVRERYLRIVRQQVTRTRYSESGTIFGLRAARFHGILKQLYNTPAISRVRWSWANARGREVGGWFDIHASRCDTREL